MGTAQRRVVKLAKRKDGRWYDIDEVSANLFWPEYSYERLAVFFSSEPVFINNRLFKISTSKPYLLGGILNSTVVQLFALVTGPRAGAGAKGLRVDDLKSLKIPFLGIDQYEKQIEKSYKKLLKREVLTIFEEVGASNPEEVSLDRVMPDRRALDQIVMGQYLGLTDEEQVEVYKALIDVVGSGTKKAKTQRSTKTTKDGVDIEALVSNILEKIGDDSLGQHYRELLQATPNELYEKEVPECDPNNLEICEGLFGWEIVAGGYHIGCQSEDEARYLACFIGTGLTHVMIPCSSSLLNRVLPEIEGVKERNASLIDSYLDYVVSPSTRHRLRERIWAKLLG